MSLFTNWKIALKRFIRLKQEKYNRHKDKGKSPSPVSSLVPHATHAALSYAIIAFRDRQIDPHTVWLFQLTYLLFSSNSAIAILFCLTQTKCQPTSYA